MNPARLRAAIDAAVGRAGLPGVVGWVANADDVRFVHAAGTAGLGDERPMAADSVMWIASMSKAITAIAVLQAVDRGEVGLDDPVSRWLPEIDSLPVLEGFDDQGDALLRPARRSPRLRELLTHTSGLGYEFLDAGLARYFERQGVPPVISGTRATLMRPRLADPGERWDYGVGLDWAGRVLEAATGQRLGELFEARIFAPLGLRDTGFMVSEAQSARLCGMSVRKPDGTLAPLRFRMPADAEFEMGGHGLYSTPQDFMRVLQAVLRGSTAASPLLSAGAWRLLVEDQLGALALPSRIPTANPRLSQDVDLSPGGDGWTLGFRYHRRGRPGGRHAGSLSWAGLCNSYYWIDPHAGLAGLLMTQVMPFCDARVLALLDAFETAVYDDGD